MNGSVWRRGALLAAGLMLPCAIPAAAQVTVTAHQSVLRVENRVAVPFVVTVTDASGGSGAAAFSAVAASSTADLRRPSNADYRVSRLEPVSWSIPITAAPRCNAGGSRTDVRAEVARLKQQLATLSAAREDQAAAQIALATQIASLEITMASDELKQKRYNAYAMEVRRQYFRDSPHGQAYAEQDFNEDVEDFVNSLTQLNRMFAAADDAKRSAIDNEVRYLEPFANGADSALRQIDAEYARSADQARTGSSMLALLAEQLRRQVPGFPSDVQVAGSGRRTCGTAAGVEDWVEVTATPADPRTAVMLGEVQFNKGGRHPLAFRRLKGTDRWIAAFFWPAEAGKATVKAHVGKGTVTVASNIQPGRATLAETRKAAESNIRNVKKRYQTLKFRAEGSDGIKTIIIP